jgi:hypothetical protein
MASEHDDDNLSETTGDESSTEDGGLSDALGGGESGFYIEEKPTKSASGLVLFGLVLAAAGATYFMYLRTGPKSAAAAPADVAAANTTISKFLKDGKVSIQSMEELRLKTEKVINRLMNPNLSQVPLKQLKSNPFRFMAPVDPNDVSEATAKRRREADRQAALKAVGGLSLQSVMVAGTRSACMINKTLYTEGQQVDIFTIDKITPNSVIVKANGFRFELTMQK